MREGEGGREGGRGWEVKLCGCGRSERVRVETGGNTTGTLRVRAVALAPQCARSWTTFGSRQGSSERFLLLSSFSVSGSLVTSEPQNVIDEEVNRAEIV